MVPPQSKPQSPQENGKADVPDQGRPTLNLAACLISKDALARSHAPYFHTVCSCFTLQRQSWVAATGMVCPTKLKRFTILDSTEVCQPLHYMINVLLIDKNKTPKRLRASIYNKTDFFSRTMKSGGRREGYNLFST